jgi:streptogramin lyase
MATNLRVATSLFLLASALSAQQAAFTNSGGTITLGTDLVMTGSTVASPAGSYSLGCPVTALPPGTYQAEWICTGGTITIQSNDGLTSVSGSLTSGTVIETASGGGRGHPTTYYYSFTGTFTGTMTLNGQAQAISGVTSQAATPTTSQLGSGGLSGGTTNVNTEYEPVYITDTYNYRIVRIDNMFGDNFIALGKYGAGKNQFELPWGLFVTAAGKIYVTDSTTCRLVQMDDMSGTNWTSLGHCGSGSHQFNNPMGVFVDSAGKIYVADSGNNRVVRINDIAGDQWTTFGVSGSGTGQFIQPGGVALDAAGKIYVADSGNSRIVRMDNITGANWTTFGSSGSGTNQFDADTAITLDSTGRIYIVDTYNNRIVRMDDMLGTDWTVLGGSLGGVAQFINPYGVSVDPYGTIYIADSRDYRLVMADDMNGSAWTTYGSGSAPLFDSPTSIFAVPATAPISVPTFSATSLSFGNAVVGTVTDAQSLTIANIGSAPLNIGSIVTGGDFAQTNTCSIALPAGQSCSVTVTFSPVAGGTRTGTISLNFTSAPVKTISLTGIGTLVSVSPTALNFGDVNAGGRPASLTVTIANPGIAAAGISSIALKGSPVYRLSNPCPATLAVATSCTLTVKFIPQNASIYNGTLTITDASGTAQKVTIIGVGVSN